MTTTKTKTTAPSPARYAELLAEKRTPANRRDRHRHRAGTTPALCGKCQRLAEDEVAVEALEAFDTLTTEFATRALTLLPTVPLAYIAGRIAAGRG